MIPDFFIVGAQKSGTTTLYSYLSTHPNVYMCPIKEPCHFCKDIAKKRAKKINLQTGFNPKKYFYTMKPLHVAYVAELSDYEKLFDGGKGKLIGEASTDYLNSDVAAEEIKKEIPQAKIVIILREPVSRAFSHYKMDLNEGLQLPSFPIAIKLENSWISGNGHHKNVYVDYGMYDSQVKRYLDAFGKENVKVFLFDDLKSGPQKLFDDLCEFLGIEKMSIPKEDTKNISEVPRNSIIAKLLRMAKLRRFIVSLLPEVLKKLVIRIIFSRKQRNIPKNAIDELKEVFWPMTIKLEKMIDRDLTSWRKIY